MWRLLFVACAATATQLYPHDGEFIAERRHRCVPIDYHGDICKGLPYNQTSFPNLAGMDEHEVSRAWMELENFAPLIKQHGPLLQFFLCSVYVPMCTDKVPQPIGPCRPLCERVREKALPTLLQFDYTWPEHLNCSRFPAENNDETMCMIGPGNEHDPVATSPRPVWAPAPAKDKDTYARLESMYCIAADATFTTHDRTQTCAPLCDVARPQVYTVQQRSVLTGVQIAMSVLICALSVFICVILVFSREMPERKLPRVCLLYIAIFCSIEAATKLIARMFNVACTTTTDGQSIYAAVELASLTPAACKFTAIVIYYCESVYKIWYVHMCALWMLTSVRPLYWDQKRMQKHHGKLHAISLVIPGCCVVCILLVHAVDADPATGLCAVGMQNDFFRLLFVTCRESIILALSIIFIFIGAIGRCVARPVTTSTITQSQTMGASTTATTMDNVTSTGSFHRPPTSQAQYMEIPMQQHQTRQQQNAIVSTKAPEVKQTDSCDKYMLLCILYIPFGALLIAALIALRSEPFDFERTLLRIIASTAYPLLLLPCFCAMLCRFYWPQAPAKTTNVTGTSPMYPQQATSHSCAYLQTPQQQPHNHARYQLQHANYPPDITEPLIHAGVHSSPHGRNQLYQI